MNYFANKYLKMKTFLFCFFLFLLSCNNSNNTNPHVQIETSVGNVEIELYADKAPLSVAAFLKNVAEKNYTDGSFYRALKVEDLDGNLTGVLQGGVYIATQADKIKMYPLVPHESTKQTGLTHQNGTLSFARLKPGTASTEFFICIGNQNQFDYSKSSDVEGYAAFGKVVSGMSIVKLIQSQPSTGEALNKKVLIEKIIKL
jgi:peptidyl-prolyl cis-trans isomerase A (cyclophilin A)